MMDPNSKWQRNINSKLCSKDKDENDDTKK